MWIVSLSLMTLWMACAVLGLRFFGLTHLLAIAAIVLEVLRHSSPRRQSSMSR
jgi:hypothetical protein